ncbi:MAG: hypothetical protein ACE5JR_13120 [Gemmatimonadota bacterium]
MRPAEAPGAASDAAQARLVIALFRLLAIVLGTLHTWAAIAHESMNEDGISYLDLGDAWLRGEWGAALSSAWSPLYSWILGAAMRAIDPPMRWEFAVVHLLDLGIYLLALVCFEFLWRELARTMQGREPTVATGGTSVEGRASGVGLPAWAWWSVGYALFLWMSLDLIELWAVTPDMLVAALVFLAAGLLLRLERGGGRAVPAALGLTLGLAYLAKSVMLPLALVFLVLAAAALARRRRELSLLFLAAVTFLAITGTWVGLLSVARGRFTFGEAGRLTYLRYVNGVPYPHWRPGAAPEGVGAPAHPARLLMADPEVYEFASPVPGSYPLSYDPAYWYEGVSPRLDLGEQAAALVGSGRFYFDLFVRRQGGLLAAALVLLWVAGGVPPGERRLDAGWALAAMAVAALALYSIVYVEGRYVGPFLLLFWGGILSHIRLPDARGARRLLAACGATAALFPLLNVAALDLEGAAGMLGVAPGPANRAPAADRSTLASTHPSEIAEGLLAAGLQPGDGIAFVGHAFGATFARLARLRIIAEIPDHQAEAFWAAPRARRAEVMRLLAGTGARAIVAERGPEGGAPAGWEPVGQTGHYVYLPPRPRVASPVE